MVRGCYSLIDHGSPAVRRTFPCQHPGPSSLAMSVPQLGKVTAYSYTSLLFACDVPFSPSLPPPIYQTFQQCLKPLCPPTTDCSLPLHPPDVSASSKSFLISFCVPLCPHRVIPITPPWLRSVSLHPLPNRQCVHAAHCSALTQVGLLPSPSPEIAGFQRQLYVFL